MKWKLSKMKKAKARSRNAEKIRRNQPCPCGSELKYKRCCLKKTSTLSHDKIEEKQRPPRPPQEVLERAVQLFKERDLKEQERISQFGKVPPIISVKAFGKQLVGVGNTLLSSPNWKTFTNVLWDYGPYLLGKEWSDTEAAKPEAERHPVAQWRHKVVLHVEEHPAEPDGRRIFRPNGSWQAYMTFAYDLFVVEQHERLDQGLLDRLRHPEHFQGARHELFAEATCLRGGFEIKHENERDRKSCHVEFTAIHKATGQPLSVEAKSKHRPGVLGRPGVAQPPEAIRLRFGELINDAVKKNAKHPFIIFLDTNLPERAAARLLVQQPGKPFVPSGIMAAILSRVSKEHGGHDPYSLLVFTNHPDHYASNDEPYPRNHVLSVGPDPDEPGNKAVSMEALTAIHDAALLYGNIPKEFPKP